MSLMYNKEKVGQRMQPWGKPTLNVYSCEDVVKLCNQEMIK